MCLHNICVYCVYLLSIYKYTPHTHTHVSDLCCVCHVFLPQSCVLFSCHYEFISCPAVFDNTNNLLHLYSAFLGTQSAYIVRGGGGGGVSSTTTIVEHPAGWCDRQPYLRQNTPHTPATGGEETVMKTISVWGLLGGQRPVGKFGQDTGVTTPTLFRSTSWAF